LSCPAGSVHSCPAVAGDQSTGLSRAWSSAAQLSGSTAVQLSGSPAIQLSGSSSVQLSGSIQLHSFGTGGMFRSVQCIVFSCPAVRLFFSCRALAAGACTGQSWADFCSIGSNDRRELDCCALGYYSIYVLLRICTY
jgi:hypothetical protein